MSTQKIYQLIPKAMKAIGAVGKNGQNAHQHYRFRSIDDMYNKVQPVLSDLGLFFVPQIVETKEDFFEGAQGKRSIRVKLKVKYTVYADDGSSVDSIVEGEAIDASDKATNKALTAAFKYMLIQVFCLAVEGVEDPDAESPDIGHQPKGRTKPKEDLGEYVCRVGKKYVGQKLKDIDPFELDNFLNWLTDTTRPKYQPMNAEFQEFYDKADAYLKTLEKPSSVDEMFDLEQN